ncbi:hypothetical protein [Micromonospora yangpuensis]|uniref:Glucose-6-phosphate isomerase n=1 Tax=Micromonospora yangpuensis TaxID=683228 RepID=A0A1C6ULD5_9ACTN|nr:hypothetical protein [Micromonospora yangpuensis]GGM17692.1 hypothetical protein GCM10012279_39780 [Micromonospora yangpuensis]SCL54804.1 hypothetical protein GA0070617_2771 [Micromonospora yangpuensis]
MTGCPETVGPARGDLAGLDADALWSAVLAAAAGSRTGVPGVVAERCTAAGAVRLGWVSPPAWHVVREGVAAVRTALVPPTRARVVVLGTGGWCFAAQALTETTGGRAALTVLDSLDPTAIAQALADEPGTPRGVLAVSASGATRETRLLVAAVPPRDGGRLVWLRDEADPPEAFALSPGGGADQVAMLGAPLSTAFLAVAGIADGAALAAAYPRFVSRSHRIGVAAARRAGTVPVAGAVRIRFVPPRWAGPGLRRWLLQLGRQVLGGKPGRWRPTVELACGAEGTPAVGGTGRPEVVFDLGGLRRDLPALLDGLYAAGVFVACVGLRAGLDVAEHPNVRVYKEHLAHADPDEAGHRSVAVADLPDTAARWLTHRPEVTRLHVVGYWSAAERDLPSAARFTGATGRPCEVHEGSAWNHHSFQAGYPDPTVAVLIVTRGVEAGTDPTAAPPVRAAARALRRIAVATHRSLPERSLLVSSPAVDRAEVSGRARGGG